MLFFFFFQAEDGIRDIGVTGVQTCALPISGLRSVLADAGVASPPILDWFHLSMRLRHAEQAAEGLPPDAPDQPRAKAAIVAEVGRLRWRAWNGKAKDARVTLERIRALLPALGGEGGDRRG